MCVCLSLHSARSDSASGSESGRRPRSRPSAIVIHDRNDVAGDDTDDALLHDAVDSEYSGRSHGVGLKLSPPLLPLRLSAVMGVEADSNWADLVESEREPGGMSMGRCVGIEAGDCEDACRTQEWPSVPLEWSCLSHWQLLNIPSLVTGR